MRKRNCVLREGRALLYIYILYISSAYKHTQCATKYASLNFITSSKYIHKMHFLVEKSASCLSQTVSHYFPNYVCLLSAAYCPTHYNFRLLNINTQYHQCEKLLISILMSFFSKLTATRDKCIVLSGIYHFH